MKIVIAVLAVMPMLAHAAPAAARDVSRLPLINRPQPNPPCGDYWDDCGEERRRDKYLLNLKAGTAGLSAAVADGKLDKAGESLNGLFAGAGAKENGPETPAVAAGDLTSSPRWVLGVPKVRLSRVERQRDVPSPSLRNVDCGDKDGCRSETGKVVEDAFKGIVKPIEKWVERDRTQESRDTYGGCRMKGTCPK